MTPDQALAFVKVMVKSPKVEAHLGAVLGHKGVPTVEDFEATNEEAFDKVEWFLDYLESAHQVLRACHKDRPKQKSIKLDGPGPEEELAEERRARRKVGL